MYKVYIDGVERTPRNLGSVSIDFEKNDEDGALFFRKKLSGALIFDGDNYAYFAGISDICQQIDLQIDQICQSGTTTIYEGFTAITKCTFHTDNCYLEAEFETTDEYTCIFEGYEKEINILDNTTIAADIEVHEAEGLEILANRVGFPPTDAAFWQVIAGPIFVNGEFFEIRARARTTRVCSGGAPPNIGFFNGEVWAVYQNDCATTNTVIYWRQPTFSEIIAIGAGLGWTSCTPNTCIPPAIPTGTQLINRVVGLNTTVDFYITIATFESNLTGTLTLDNGRGLLDTIDFMLSEMGCGLTVETGFFDGLGPTDPQGLVLFEKSDVVKANGTENASISLLTFKDLMSDLHNLYNVRWYVNSVTNKLVIEHISDISNVPGLDLTAPPFDTFARNKNTYEYVKEEIPLQEVWKYPLESVDIDFKGYPIDFPVSCYTLNEKIRQTRKIETHFRDIYLNPEAGLEGVVLVDPESINAYGVNSSRAENGAITGIFKSNAGLGFGWLIPRHWNQDRPLPAGEVNGIPTFFPYPKKLRQQQEISIPFAPLDSTFNPIDEITTFLGAGLVENASYNLRARRLNIEIRHD